MPIKVNFQQVTITEVEAEIPDNCPKCGASLSAEGSIVEGNYVYCGVRSHVEGGKVEAEGYSDYSDEYHPIGYICHACQTTLAGEGV